MTNTTATEVEATAPTGKSTARMMTERQGRHLLLAAAHTLSAENGKLPSAQDATATQAKARLIAAAPELVAIVQQLATMDARHPSQSQRERLQVCYRDARALLARIQGVA